VVDREVVHPQLREVGQVVGRGDLATAAVAAGDVGVQKGAEAAVRLDDVVESMGCVAELRSLIPAGVNLVLARQVSHQIVNIGQAEAKTVCSCTVFG
jgi:hypothetical protein